jgi:hypothetical protein
MDEKLVEINGQTFDLSDPEGKKAAVRAWLAAKSKERKTPPPEEESQSKKSD